jgi:NADH pyrophosphatase NudC (nudix superfamily)
MRKVQQMWKVQQERSERSGGTTMIEKIYKNKRMVICDNCGIGQECNSWADAIDFMNEEGWKKKLADGEWKHYCPECQESEVEHDG